jgi:serine/threonine-protein kinase
MTTPHPDEPTVRVSADHTPRAPLNLAQFGPGTLIAGRYRIASMLGSGGMGEVYRADDIKLGQVVALKFLPAALARDPVLLGRLHDEVRLGRQVSHPNVCRIYDIGEFGHAHFVAMEYVDGEDLAHLLRRIGRLAHDKGIELAHGIAAGLAAAHAKGILHRDLKPANVMIDSRGNPRITDFGLALDFNDSGHADAAGTPAYMAPEQLDGQPASVQSDLYALGLVMYEMFTGRRPYGGRSVAELRDALSTETAPPSSHVRDVEPMVEQIILRCLSRDPAQRPRSAREVLEALPGGDPLAMALAAGETPSPRVVAAAGSEGVLRRGVAWAWLGGVAALLAMLIGVHSQWNGRKRISFDMPSAVLEERAADIATALGLPRPIHRVSGMLGNSRYLSWVSENDRSPGRFADLRRGPAAVIFSTRLSREPLTPRGDQPFATFDDPPMTNPGDALVMIDTGGRLVRLTAVPPGPAKGTADWNRLLGLAGFDAHALRRVEPRELPPYFADERAAWDGVWPDAPSRPVHIEAAAAGGVPVWFQASGPWDTSGAETRRAFAGRRLDIVFGTVVTAAALLCLFLGWRNFRLRRGDRAGARRLAVTFLTISAASTLLAADYSGGLGHQMRLATTTLQKGLLLAAIVYVAYVALEPFMRRRWPDLLIGWTRLLGGRFRDPMVGRDVLIGVAAGIAHALLAALSNWLPGRMGWELPAMPRFTDYSALLSLRHTLAALLSHAIGSFFFALIPMLILIGLTILLRRRTYAGVALFLVMTAVYAVAARGNPYIFVVSVIIALIWTALTVRVGLLAIMVGQYVFYLVFSLPSAIDVSSWAAASLMAPLVLVAALAVYAFRTSLGGQPAFSGSLIDD